MIDFYINKDDAISFNININSVYTLTCSIRVHKLVYIIETVTQIVMYTARIFFGRNYLYMVIES